MHVISPFPVPQIRLVANDKRLTYYYSISKMTDASAEGGVVGIYMKHCSKNMPKAKKKMIREG